MGETVSIEIFLGVLHEKMHCLVPISTSTYVPGPYALTSLRLLVPLAWQIHGLWLGFCLCLVILVSPHMLGYKTYQTHGIIFRVLAISYTRTQKWKLLSNVENESQKRQDFLYVTEVVFNNLLWNRIKMCMMWYCKELGFISKINI